MKRKKQLDYQERVALRAEMDDEIRSINDAIHLTPGLFSPNPDDATLSARYIIDMKISTVRGIAKQLGIRRPFDELPMDVDIDELKLRELDRHNQNIKNLVVRLDKNMQIIANHPEYESLVFCPASTEFRNDLSEFEKLVGMSFMEHLEINQMLCQKREK